MDAAGSRRALLAGLGTALAGAAGCLSWSEAVVFEESFERPIPEWNRGADAGDEGADEPTEWSIGRSEDRAAAGSWSVAITTGGALASGAAWLSQPVDLPGAERYRLELEAWSAAESFDVLRDLVALLAPAPPRTVADFPDPGRSSTNVVPAPAGGLREPLHRSAGWESYAFEWAPRDRIETAHLAVGVGVVAATETTHYLDAFRLTVA